MLSLKALKMHAAPIVLFPLIWCLFFHLVPHRLIVTDYADLVSDLQQVWYVLAGSFGPPFILVWMFYTYFGPIEHEKKKKIERIVEVEDSVLIDNNRIVSSSYQIS